MPIDLETLATGAMTVTRETGAIPGSLVGDTLLIHSGRQPGPGDMVAVPHPEADEYRVEAFCGQAHAGVCVGIVFGEARR